MNLTEMLLQLSKSILLIALSGYLLVLMPYFLTHNMPLQYDNNIISILFIILMILTIILLLTLSFAYFIDRSIKLIDMFRKQKDYKVDCAEVIDSTFYAIILIFLPLTVNIFFINIFTVNSKISVLYIFTLPLISILLWKYKPNTYYKIKLSVIVITMAGIGIYIIFKWLDTNILVFLIFCMYFVMSVIKNQQFINTQCIRNFSLIKWYKIFILNNKNKNSYIFHNKINPTIAIIIILILFTLFNNSYYKKYHFEQKITNNILRILNIGAFKGTFIIDKNVSLFINDVNKSNMTNNKYITLTSHILWDNDKYLYIQNDKNITIPISKIFIPINVIKTLK